MTELIEWHKWQKTGIEKIKRNNLMLQLAVPLQHSVTADHQENSPQLSNAKAFKSEMQVKDFKKKGATRGLEVERRIRN